MDLRTVKERLVAMQYRTPLDFRDDVRQVRAIHWGDWGEGIMKLVCLQEIAKAGGGRLTCWEAVSV